MSLIDDFIESSEAMHGPSATFYTDAHMDQNGHARGFDSVDNGRLDKGYVSTGFGQVDHPTFSLESVEFQLPANLVDMAVSNNVLVVALDIFRILRIDLDHPEKVDEIEITRVQGDGKISKIFFDPTGRHLIITTDHGENYYLYHSWIRTKHLSKFKGVTISSIAWNKQATQSDPSTKEILIGTRNGLIYETYLEPVDEFFRKEERYFKQVYSIHETTMPISGLYFEQFPTNNRKYFVMATTSSRIYQFIGMVSPSNSSKSSFGFSDSEDRGERAIFEGLFSKYDVTQGFQELPGDLAHSELHLFTPHNNLSQLGLAQTFAWLSGPGVYHGDLIFASQNVGDSVIENAQLLQYPSLTPDQPDGKDTADLPLSITLTEFHFIFLYKDRVRAICQLSDQIVYEEPISLFEDEKIVGMISDVAKKTFWVYSTTAIYELVVKDEERDVWKIYLEKKQYDTATQYCKDPAQKDMVDTARARDYFSQHRYQQSAEYFAESTVPFEEVTLMFIEKEEMDALRVYLQCKLNKLQKSDQTQRTMICTWLVQLYVSKLCDLEDAASSAHCVAPNDVANGTVQSPSQIEMERDELRDELRSFFATHAAYLDKRTTNKLLSTYGLTAEMLDYVTMAGDFDTVINHWIAEKNWTKALEMLSKQGSTETMYKFAQVLMVNAPYETVTIWMRQTNLNPRLLIPALLRYNHAKVVDKVPQNQAIRYLSYVISTLGNTDPLIHNLLLTMYAMQPTRDESVLLAFLKNEGRDMHYNLDYALRLCTQYGRTQSCVHIFSQLQLYEEAVHLALQHDDIELAIINADKPEDDEELRRKLSLRIAKYMIQDKKDMTGVMTFLGRNSLINMEDVLPFFPDFVTIDGLKDDICGALEDYIFRLDHLKSDMAEATKNAESIRFDIRELKRRFMLAGAAETCCLCDRSLYRQPFYLFPCQHGFHVGCLTEHVTAVLPTRHRHRLVHLMKQLQQGTATSSSPTSASAGSPPPPTPTVTSAAALLMQAATGFRDVVLGSDPAQHQHKDPLDLAPTEREQFWEEIGDIVAGECILCGEMMIKSIDKPFIDDEVAHADMAAWAV